MGAEIQAQLLLQTQAQEMNAPDRPFSNPGPKKAGLLDASWMSKLSGQKSASVGGKRKWEGSENAPPEEVEKWKASGWNPCDEWVDPATASAEDKEKWGQTGWSDDW